ncbi:ADP-ribose pyrophosphatase YjhB (NUDIX family) [Rhizobium subbaraonis]|uniref:ADP-ribose pyrophosphatase YjhB (NUDIX family) n=1 Tax=Rhizobium subbaraonis TaxID=908946 RepID=A0A285U9H2_9HYPH|nr:NUDIX domain-containing protein [Rhizobium subbaraonis]SOC36941.1 ADP-ribose pyrophosphatase YjhB (NUDIX family) [Rhizobium subbaraonis]
MSDTIRIAAALLVRPDGQTLLVRKRGGHPLMQPGGKIDPGETPHGALLRELQEEIGFDPEHGISEALGEFTAEALNESGRLVHAHVFLVRTQRTDFRPSAEIDEVRWISPFEPGPVAMASLTADHILPFYRALSGGS